MFDIEQITLFNFRSFKGKHEIKLPTTSGLYLITGKNEAEPRLAGNGVGKSSLFDAIYWCLYGRTTRGLKAGDIVSWDEKSCSVIVKFKLAKGQAVVKRIQAPNSLLLNGRPVSQGALEEYLRIGPEAFTYAVMMPQFGDCFLDLSPEPKLKVFTEIMDLDFWLEKAKVAEELSNEVLALKAVCDLQVSKLNGQRELLATDIRMLESRSASFINDQKEAIKQTQRQLTELSASRVNTAKAIEFAEAAIANVDRKQVGMSGKLCPTCKQPIPNKASEALKQNKRDFERKLLTLSAAEARDEATQISLTQEIDREAKRVNLYAEQIAEKQGKIKAAKARLVELKLEIQALDEDYAASSYWVTGFKRVRLFLVEQTLRKLEVEINNSMNSLGLMDWRIELGIERENKSGSVTKGFTVMVYPPGRQQPIRFEAYSGGETQRLRLAGDLGLANLIMERAGLTSMVEFYDEPASFLSEEGLLDVAETLQQRALSTGKRIFLVDHSAMDFDATGRLLILKDDRGSRMEIA